MGWSQKWTDLGTIKITLPTSKSIVNRLLAIERLTGMFSLSAEVAMCEDTQIMFRATRSKDIVINAGESGTAMRFLLALFSCKESNRAEITLTGETRLRERPISPLVDTLRYMGATLEYLDREGFLPVRITPMSLRGGKVKIDSRQSSQFVSALMLIAPLLPEGLDIEINSENSKPYILLTANIMEECGVESTIEANRISIKSQQYTQVPLQVESDFSSLAFWYAFFVVSKTVDTLEFSCFYENSKQPDRRIVDIIRDFGVSTEFSGDSIIIKKAKNFNKIIPTEYAADMSTTPDLVPVLSAMCCLLGVKFSFYGVKNLRVKESDRLEAIRKEFLRLGYYIVLGEDMISWNGDKYDIGIKKVNTHSHSDHRIAMALALMAERYSIDIDDKTVVCKSYPNFWHDLQYVKTNS